MRALLGAAVGVTAAAIASVPGLTPWSLLAGAVAFTGVVLARPAPPRAPVAETPPAPSADAEPDRRSALRHDIRGILSPVMLGADRLTTHPDPGVQRTATMIVAAVERVTERLGD